MPVALAATGALRASFERRRVARPSVCLTENDSSASSISERPAAGRRHPSELRSRRTASFCPERTGACTLARVADIPAENPVHEIRCPHCKKTFTAELIAGDTERHRGFKCPHCKLFVPAARAAKSRNQSRRHPSLKGSPPPADKQFVAVDVAVSTADH